MESLFIFVLMVCNVVVTRAATFSCPANPGHETQFLFEQHCYEFVTNQHVDWTHANADCIRKGGWLTDIHSANEQAFIVNTLRSVGLHGDKGVWIGFNDRDREGTWIWTSGTNVNYKHWASGQPGGITLNDEDCALLDVSSDGYWHDFPCEEGFFSSPSHGWVCKFAAVPVTVSTMSTTSTTSAGMASSTESATVKTTMMLTQKPTDAVTPGTVTVVVTERPTEPITTTLPMTSIVITEKPTDVITTTLPMTSVMTSQSQAQMASDTSQQPAMSTTMQVITTQSQRR